jgi:hypothetical protein
MKKLLLIAGLLWASAASAQFTPGQVLTAAELNNQFALYALLSGATYSGLVTIPTLTVTGTANLPAGSVPATSLGAQAANTVVANVTAASASPTAVTIPTCNTTTSALQYTPSTGFTCFTGSAPSASPSFTGPVASSGIVSVTNNTGSAGSTNGALVVTGGVGVGNNLFVAGSVVAGGGFTGSLSGAVSANTITASGAITPSQTAGIVGTTTNNNANAGSVGEYISSSIPSGSAVSLTSNSPVNITSITLTAGDWLVCGTVDYLVGGTTVVTQFTGWISATSATLPGGPNGGAYFSVVPLSTAGIGNQSFSVGCIRELLASSATIFLSTQVSFSTSTASAYGFVGASRRR